MPSYAFFTRAVIAAVFALLIIGSPFKDAPATEKIDDRALSQAASLRDAALKGSPAYDILESLTTEVGPRLAGTEAEARARVWALSKLRELGLLDAREEAFTLPTWVRGVERGAITAPYPQPLYLTALGNSGATGEKGLEAELVVFPTLADLENAPAGSLKGKIAYVGHSMKKTQDGSHYGFFGNVRRSGPALAAQKGAAGMIIRSVGTDSRRFPHTGGTRFPDGVAAIPSAAVSNPDADQIERIHARGETLRIKMTLTPRQIGDRQSGNIIVDIPGTDLKDEIIILGGHLDSWDLGTGALDDGAGVAIATAAAKMIKDAGLKPRRTIRLVLWGSEEVGLIGGFAYANRHKATAAKHMLGSESDFGAGPIYQVIADVSDEGKAVVDQMMRLLAPLGISLRTAQTSSGPDLIPLNRMGLPAFRLAQDGTDYFDLHHTPDDTLDKVNPHDLDQNVAAYLVFLWLAANTDTEFRKPQPTP